MIDVNDGYAVLSFTYNYLRKKSVAPDDTHVRNVTRAVAQYHGPHLVTISALETFVTVAAAQ